MNKRIEEVIKYAHRFWKRGRPAASAHPDEETLALFVDGRLGLDEARAVKAHLVECSPCGDMVAAGLCEPQEVVVPAAIGAAELILRLKDKVIEIIRSSGDVIVGQELVPASVLRSRNMSEFRDAVAILKDFDRVRVEARVAASQGSVFSVRVCVLDSATGKALHSAVRITLSQGDRELESYSVQGGIALFERIAPGKYVITVAIESVIAACLNLDVTA